MPILKKKLRSPLLQFKTINSDRLFSTYKNKQRSPLNLMNCDRFSLR
ncbi:MAG: hypothetical protein KA717_38010 [Woronichinia naegeliana WA131]|uniref:Uncharacterized protein n=1 Tax=Woronichinia naegeliana WA131 TaxID=2824559 RepID=A0A977KWE2_9CYAN|nr:MAG: hypothetical protein KA717_38010 [Woronichinia naegeliana WA131]